MDLKEENYTHTTHTHTYSKNKYDDDYDAMYEEEEKII